MRVTLVVRRCLPGELQLLISLQRAFASVERFDARSSFVVADDGLGLLAALAAGADSRNVDVSRTIVQKVRLFRKYDDPCSVLLLSSLEDFLSSGNDSDSDLMVNSIFWEFEFNPEWVGELHALGRKNSGSCDGTASETCLPVVHIERGFDWQRSPFTIFLIFPELSDCVPGGIGTLLLGEAESAALCISCLKSGLLVYTCFLGALFGAHLQYLR